MLKESEKEIEPVLREFKRRMKEKGIPERAVNKIIELQKMNIESKARKIKDKEERKKFEVEYMKDFIKRYERWVEVASEALVE